jgi:hypothetical protein
VAEVVYLNKTAERLFYSFDNSEPCIYYNESLTNPVVSLNNLN